MSMKIKVSSDTALQGNEQTYWNLLSGKAAYAWNIQNVAVYYLLLLFFVVLRATKGVRNTNLQVSITNACHIHMQPVVWTSFKNEWNALKAIWWSASGPSITWNLRKAQRWPGKERLHLSCPRTLILFITSFNLGSHLNFYYYILLLLLLLLFFFFIYFFFLNNKTKLYS